MYKIWIAIMTLLIGSFGGICFLMGRVTTVDDKYVNEPLPANMLVLPFSDAEEIFNMDEDSLILE